MKRMVAPLRMPLLAAAVIGAAPLNAGAWAWRPAPVPRALLVEGLWTDTLRLRAACHAAGLPYDGAYKTTSPYFRPNHQLRGMPAEPSDYGKYAVIVLSNIDAVTLGPERLAIIREFVENGGGLVVLGGYWAYHRGGYAGTVLEDMLPVEFPPENRIPPQRDGVLLEPARTADWPMDYDFSPRPAAFFVQRLLPKPGAIVQLTAGEQAALVSGAHDRGRVVAVALTANGVAPEGSTVRPYWDWEDWPRLLGAAMDWAAGARPLRGHRSDEPAAAALSDDDLINLELAMDITDELIARARSAPTANIAEALLLLALDPQYAETVQLDSLVPLLQPFAHPGWTERLQRTQSADNPDLPTRRAALRLLGAIRSPEAFATLQRALGDTAVRLAAIDGLGASRDSRGIPLLRDLYTEAMRLAVSPLNPDRLDPEAFAREFAHLAAHAAQALYRLGDAEGVSRLAAIYAEVHLYERIFRNAGKRRTRPDDVQGLAIVRRIHERTRQLRETRAWLQAEAGPVPDAQVDALIRFAMTLRDPAQVDWVQRAMVHTWRETDIPSARWRPLRNAGDGIIARGAAAFAP